MDEGVISLAVIVLASFVYVALERLFPYDRGQKIFREGFFTDLFWYGIVQGLLLGQGITMLIRWVDDSSGLSRLQIVSDWPLWAQFLLFLVTHDLYIYLFHRLQHRSPLLWRTHEAHHSVRDVDWMAGTRSHPLEILINQTIEFLPIALLGAAPEMAAIKATVDAVWGMYIHSNIDVRSGRLQYLINGPEMHRWHHAIDMRDRNFSTKLAIWDFLFGTAYLPVDKKPAGYGLDIEHYPKDYFRQLLWAFLPRKVQNRARPQGGAAEAGEVPRTELASAPD